MKTGKEFKYGEGKWWILLERFIEWLRTHNYAKDTQRNRYEHLIIFINWCVERGLLEPREISTSNLERFQTFSSNYRKANSRYLGIETQAQRITAIKVFFRWMMKYKYIYVDPTTELIPPKVAKKLPRAIMSKEEVERLLAQPNLSTVKGIRDRAIMEVLYSTAIRRAELANLSINDVDKERGVIFVRAGKGSKDRSVPIGERAIAFIEIYLEKSRPSYSKKSKGEDEGKLFLSVLGKAFLPSGLNTLLGEYIKRAGLEKGASCHRFRHTAATLMLEAGADIRYIQEMLGHAYLSTTQIYTHVFDSKLKEVHSKTHPSAKLLKPIIIDKSPAQTQEQEEEEK